MRIGGRTIPGLSVAASLGTLLVLVGLIVAGVVGSRDPLANPLPLFVWTVWWIGGSYAHAVLGDLWTHLNPWRGPYRVVTAVAACRRWRDAPPLPYPERIGAWPALLGFLAFAWFELIHPAPADPAILAGMVGAYLLVNALGTWLFGEIWLRRAETFGVFFRIISWIAPLRRGAPRQRGGVPASRDLELTVPTLALLRVEPPALPVVAFILLVLASVSFDGLSRTFAWLGFLGVNPLVYPGRTALMLPNTLGLLGLFAALSGAYVLAVRLMRRLAPTAPLRRLVAVFAVSLVPIACGYHFAHYLPVFLVDVQWALRAVSDPFARGWNLFGTRDLSVVTSLVTDPGRVYAIWHAQIAIIVGAHVAAVVIAHALAIELPGRVAAAGRAQLPLLALMIGYTLLGLWLLSTPSVG